MKLSNCLRTVLLFLLFSTHLGGQICPTPRIMTYQVKARTTDRAIAFSTFYHYAYWDTLCPPKGQLLVHLVGTYDNPAKTTYFPKLAAAAGYHVIVLEYPNRVAAKTACAQSPLADCYNNFRREIFEGKDYSDAIAIRPADGIEHRLIALVQHLAEVFPGRGWEQFIDEEQLRWERMTLSGHSQGGGHAIFISTMKRVQRAIGFASPNDYSEYYQSPASWTRKPSMTPAANQYVFLNTEDDVVPFEEQYATCRNLGLDAAGDTTSVDRRSADGRYQNAHILYTRRTQSGLGGNHSLMIRDPNIPLDRNDQPLFTPVWLYLLERTATTSTKAVLPSSSALSIYPNPGKTLHIDVRKHTACTPSVEILDITGNPIYTSDAVEPNINTALWPRGIYRIKVQCGGHRYQSLWIRL